MSEERQTSTADLGYAIRDFIEGMAISHVDEDSERPNADDILAVDISDPHNPVAHMLSGWRPLRARWLGAKTTAASAMANSI